MKGLPSPLCVTIVTASPLAGPPPAAGQPGTRIIGIVPAPDIGSTFIVFRGTEEQGYTYAERHRIAVRVVRPTTPRECIAAMQTAKGTLSPATSAAKPPAAE